MKEEIKTRYKILLFILGILFSFSFLSTPIHEIGHVIAAYLSGGTAKITEWALTTHWGGNDTFIKYSGCGFHMLFFVLLAMSRKQHVSIFGAGGFLSSFISAITVQQNYGSDRYGHPGWAAVFWIWGALLLAGIIIVKIKRRIKFPPEARPPSKIISQFKKPSKYKTPLSE